MDRNGPKRTQYKGENVIRQNISEIFTQSIQFFLLYHTISDTENGEPLRFVVSLDSSSHFCYLASDVIRSTQFTIEIYFV